MEHAGAPKFSTPPHSRQIGRRSVSDERGCRPESPHCCVEQWAATGALQRCPQLVARQPNLTLVGFGFPCWSSRLRSESPRVSHALSAGAPGVARRHCAAQGRVCVAHPEGEGPCVGKAGGNGQRDCQVSCGGCRVRSERADVVFVGVCGQLTRRRQERRPCGDVTPRPSTAPNAGLPLAPGLPGVPLAPRSPCGPRGPWGPRDPGSPRKPRGPRGPRITLAFCAAAACCPPPTRLAA